MPKKGKKSKGNDVVELPSAEITALKDDFEPEFDPHSSEQLGLGYQNTLLYGHYSRKLGEFARLQKLLGSQREKKKGIKGKISDVKRYYNVFLVVFKFIWRNTLGRIGEDWIFLTLVGILAGTLSFTIDRTIGICNSARQWLFKEVAVDNIPAQYFAWCALPVVLVLFASCWVYLISPQAAGSGVAPIKVILRGVPIEGFLSFKTLVAKSVGLACAVGAQMQVGREGPLIHISCCIAQVLSKYISGFKGIYRNRSRNTEMLAAACAIGVGCCFGAPIGGLIMSVEVTTTYYYTRNYIRGFYGAVWATIFYRLLEVWFKNTHSMLPKFPTNFAMDFPFKPQEMFVYALLGITCGIGGGIFVQIHRNYVMYVKGWGPVKKLLGKFRYLYPTFISWLVVSMTFPPGIGRFMAGHIGTGVQVKNLFSNFTWSAPNLTVEQQAVVNNWTTPMSGIFCNLSVFVAFTYFFAILCFTLPVPAGCFMPTFKIGAGYGRIIGELMHNWFPDGIKYYDMMTPVTPGGYSLAGAAAFTGAVTHTVAPAVIAFEMSGQIKNLVPTLIAILLSNATASLIAPGQYDSTILFKGLPYLPDLLPCSSGMHSIYVKDFMIEKVKFIWHNMTFGKLKDVLKENKKLRQFPLVDSEDNMHLLGSIHRMQLIRLLENQVGTERRQQWVTTRVKEAQEKARLQSVQQPETHKRTSRFEVMPSPDVLVVKKLTTDAWGIEQFPKDTTYDMSPEDRRRWEEEQMRLPVDFSKCRIDPAPFQLVETTSLLKVHSLFSMIGIDTGYVTAQGKLVGVVGLTELRQAIQDANDGKLPPHDLEIKVPSRTPRRKESSDDDEEGSSDDVQKVLKA